MKQKQPRVLNTIGSLETGGAESLLYYLHKHLKDKGYDNFTICTLISGGDFYQKAKEERLQVISLNLSSKRDPRAIPRLIEVIRNGQYNIVHSHLPAAAFCCSLASLFLPDRRFIFTFHSTPTSARMSLVERLCNKLVGRRMDQVIVVNNASRKGCGRLLSIPGSRIHLVYNAVNPDIFSLESNITHKLNELGLDNHTPISLAVGNMREAKGYDILVQAAKILKDKDEKFILLIAGEGPLWAELHKLRDSLGLQNEVRFLGKRSDVPELLQMADIFVQASNYEGMSISILEAMISGKPIVATDVHGTRESIRNGIEGLLVPPKDPSSLSSAIMKLLRDSNMRLKFGENAKKRAYEGFTMDSMEKNLISLYYAIVNWNPNEAQQ